MRASTHILRSAMVLGAAAAFVWAGAALAQQGSYGEGRGAAPPGESAASQFGKEDLQAFAEAQQEVQKVGERYRSKLGQGEDPETRMELREQMQEELAEAVRSAGLEVGTYNAIANAAQNDPAVARKIEELR